MAISISKNEYLNALDKNQPVVLGLSGGVDSMVLFDLLLKNGFKVIIAHVNHHKREQSKMEEAYLRALAQEKNIPIYVLDYYHEGDNFQAEAHNKRYEFFYNIVQENNASAILTAHHAQDNLETILMNLIRGSNIYGYAGIKEMTPYRSTKMIRPLLHFDKEDIYTYAKENNVIFFEDSSNEEDDYLRNRIRHHIIPLLKQENPSLYSSIDNYSNQLFNAFAYIRENSVKYITQNGYKIQIESFNKLAIIQKKDIINYIFDENSILSSDNKICDILDIIASNKPNLFYDLGNNLRFVKSYDECYITEQLESPDVYEEINRYDSLVLEGYGNFYFRKVLPENCSCFIKIDNNEKYPLIIRHRKHGDRISVGGGHKKLKDYLIDKKVPKEVRDNILVITNALDEILWVVGYYRKPCKDPNALNFIFEEKKNNE